MEINAESIDSFVTSLGKWLGFIVAGAIGGVIGYQASVLVDSVTIVLRQNENITQAVARMQKNETEMIKWIQAQEQAKGGQRVAPKTSKLPSRADRADNEKGDADGKP